MAEPGRLELQGVDKAYRGGIVAARGVDLAIDGGELFVLLGPSGSGKSTLLRLIAGLETPDSGSIWLGGRRIDGLHPRDRGVQMVFQDQALYPHLDVFENIAFGLRARRTDRSEVDATVRSTAGMLGLGDCLGRPPATLSGGQRRRVALARALATRPKVFLLDEPFSGLDAPLRNATRAVLIDLKRQTGATMVLVTHDQAEALAIADRLAVIEAGRVVQVGRPAEVYERPDRRFVGRFVGQPPMSFLPCLVGLDAGSVAIRVVDVHDQGPWIFPRSGWSVAALAEAGVERVDLGIRAEDVLLGPPGPSTQTEDALALTAVVHHVELLGSEVLASLRVGPHSLAIRLPASSTVRVGWVLAVRPILQRACWFRATTGERLGRPDAPIAAPSED